MRALAALYREAGARAGHTDALRLGIGVHFFAGESEKEAHQTFPFCRDFLGPKRPNGSGMTVTKTHFDAGFEPNSTRYIGSTEQVTEKVVALYREIHFDRFQALLDWGGLPPAQMSASLARLADSVKPAVVAAAEAE